MTANRSPQGSKPPTAPKSLSSAAIRILPVVSIGLVGLFGIKAIALATEANEANAGAAEVSTAQAGEKPGEAGANPAADPAGGAGADEAAGAPAKANGPNECAAAAIAEEAGLTTTELKVLQSLGDRRVALEARDKELSTRESLLEAAQQELSTRVSELKTLEASIKKAMGEVDAEEEKRLAGLVTVYTKMKSKDAARIFDNLDEELLVNVARRMKEGALAEILAAMSAEKARVLTKRLSQRPVVPNAPLADSAAKG